MEHSCFNFKTKAIDEAGKFSGLLASFNTVDLGGDKILPGAFTKTLAGGKSFPLLWQHDPNQPIGSFTAKETSQGLQIDGELILSIQTAANARELLRRGVLKGLSIGYDTLKSNFVGDVRELSELRLWEGSVVTFPMNTEAMVTSIKAVSDQDRAKLFKAINFHRKSIDKHQRAIRESLKSLGLFDGIDDDDPGDDPDIDEPTAGETEEMSTFIAELKSLALEAGSLA